MKSKNLDKLKYFKSFVGDENDKGIYDILKHVLQLIHEDYSDFELSSYSGDLTLYYPKLTSKIIKNVLEDLNSYFTGTNIINELKYENIEDEVEDIYFTRSDIDYSLTINVNLEYNTIEFHYDN